MNLDVSDLLIICGFGCVLVGLWWLLPAAAMIVGGLGLIVVGILLTGRQNTEEEP